MSRTVLFLLGVALASVTLAALFGCSGRREGERKANLSPHVKLTGGPREGSRDHYRTKIYWTGWDDDGVIAHYEYAIDPPSAFSLEEISFPESSPGVMVTRVPSLFTGNPDTVRVTKDEDGVVFRFDYIQTHLTDQVFHLPATENDTIITDVGRLEPSVTSSGVHTVYVRAMDNEGAYSEPDRIGFTSWTYTPTSWILYPETKREILRSGPKLIIRWDGTDPDPPPRSREKPVGYLYKLINLSSLIPPLNVLFAQDAQKIAFERASHVPWIYQDAETSGVVLHVNPGQYLFALRAVDAVGGIEPFLEWRRGEEPPGNAFLVQVIRGGGVPRLDVFEPLLGEFVFYGSTRFFEKEVPVGTELRFQWSATAEEYGGRIEGYSWGIDVADLDEEGQEAGWSPWGVNLTTSTPITFHHPGIHVLYIRARDSNGSITIATIAVKFFDFAFNREVLFVDDYMDRGFPLDRDHDAFWREMFTNSNRFSEFDIRPENFWFDAAGPDDHDSLAPRAPKLSFLGQYRMLVWNLQGGGYCGRSGFFNAARMSSHMLLYLKEGGKLWLSGRMTPAATLRGADCPPPSFADREQPQPAAETTYPHSYVPGDFAWDFLKLQTLRLDNNKGMEWFHALDGVVPWNPQDPILPALDVDPQKVGSLAWERSGLSHGDAVFDPILVNNTPGFRGQVDSLYAYVASGPNRRPWDERTASEYHGRLIGIRWHDPDPAREHGRVMWFGFPLYYMMNDQAQETFNRAIDWFREEELPPREEP